MNHLARVLAFGVAIVAAAITLPSVAAARAFALDDLQRLVDIQEPQISPDGQAVAVVVIRPDYAADAYDTTLELVNVASHSRRALTSGRNGVNFPRWSPDGGRIAFIAETSGDNPTAQVFVLSLDGGDARQVTHASNDVQQIAWSPDGKTIAYVTADDPKTAPDANKYNDGFVVDNNDFLATAAATPNHIWLAAADGSWHHRLTSGPMGLPSMNATYATTSAMRWSSDGRYIAFSRLPDAVEDDEYLQDIQMVDVSTGAIHKLTPGVYQMMPEFSPDGAQVLFAYPHDGDYNQGNEIFVAPAAGGPARSLTAALDRNALIAKWMPDGANILIGANAGTASALWLQPASGGAAQRLDLGDVNWINDSDWEPVTVGRSGSVAFTGSTGTDPTELYYMATPTSPLVKLTDLNDPVASLDIGKTVTVDWQSDGFAEDGALTYPPGYTPGRKYPLAIFIHGGPIWASNSSFNDLTQLLASAGFLVLRPNYRGSDNLGNAYERAISPDAGAGPGRDVMAGIAAVEKLGIVDENRIGVSGWSYGGYMASWMITHYKIWKAAVSGAAVDDWVIDYDVADDHKADALQLGATPDSDPTLYHAVSPLTYAANVTAPTLIMCDTGDPRVPIPESYEFYHALKDHNVPVSFVAYPVDGHLPPDPVRNADIDRRWVAWLKDHV
jgi:dipeptidyl aminopeptidase/acylaminoacyl peptidase